MRLTVLLLFSFFTISQFLFSQNFISNEYQLWANEPYSNYRLQDEDISKRTVDSKHFVIGGKGTAIVSAGFLNYYEDNQWKTIFHTILPTNNGFSNETNAFKSFYPLNSDGQALTILPNGGEVKDLMQLQMSYLNEVMGQVSTKTISSKTGVANKFELTYPRVFGNNIDLRLTQMTTKRKLDFILKNRNALSDIPNSARYLSFSEVVELQQGWTLQLINNEILVKDQNGKVRASFDAPIVRETAHHAHDKDGNHIDHHDHEINATFKVELVGSNRYKVSTIVPLEWLLSTERKFPIFVDPTINCYPDNTAQWTGHLRLNGNNSTDYNTNTIGQRVNDVMILGRRETPSPFAHFNSWAKFNLTSVPNTAVLCKVRLNYTVFESYSGTSTCVTGIYIKNMTIDPVPATDASILSNIRSSNNLMTRAFSGANGTDANHTTPDFASVAPFQNAIINPDWISLGFQYYDGGPHTTCSLKIRGYSHSAKPYLIIDYNNASSFSNVGYTGQSNGTVPPNPNCTGWSNTWCAGSGTFTPIPNIVQGVNYTIENVGSGGCNPVLTNAYLQAWAPGGPDCGRTPVGSHALNNYSFNATNNGTYYFNVSSGLCANNNTCGSFTGHDWTGTSAVLRYRQNTTVTNTTPTTDLCVGQSRPLTATLGGTHNNPTVTWTITSGSNLGTISGSTFTAGNTAGQVTIQATVGFCSQSITFNIVNGPTVTSTTQAICSGETVNIPIQASPPQASYTWSVNSINVSGASNGTGTNINQTLALVNTGTSGSVTYTVTAASGACAGTGNIVVNVNPPPTVSIAPLTICEGETNSLVATPSEAGGTFLWSPGGQTTASIFVNPTTNTSYSVTYSLGQCTPATATQTVTVTPAPTVSVSSITICSGETSSLTAIPTEAGGTYAWSSGGTTATISVNPTTTSSYTVTYSLGSCTPATANATVTVNPAPTVSVSPITICSGETSSLSATVSEAGGNYLWSPGGATTSSISVNPTSNTSYTVTYTLGFCTPQSATAQVTVNPAPTVTINPLTICSGETGTLTATVTQTGGAFIWSPGGETTSSISVNPTTGTSYSVTYTLGQCTPGTATVNVFVNPAPTVTINTTSICVGQSATLTATPTETGGTYLWSPGGQTSQAITVNPTQNTTYSVTYSLGQCTQATASSILTVQPVPTITLSSPTICTGTNANITATVSPTGGSYSWSTAATTNSLSVNPTTNTNYSLTYSVNGCTNSAQTTVTVFETPTVTVNSPTICAGESTTITATANPSGGTYLWSNNATNSTQVLTPTGTISYNVLYVIQGCNATATSTITVNPVPTLTLAGSTICAGESTTLTAIPNLQGGTFLWSPNGETTNVISVTPGQTSNYSVVYTLNNCLSPSVSATVTVNPMPIVTVNSGQICSGDSFTLQANGTPLGGTYTWTGHANTTSQLNVSPNSTTSYSVNYTLNGCVSQSATGVVDILPSPVASFTASATQGCSPLTVTFTNTSTSSSGDITGCLWGFGNTTSSGCGSMSQTFTQPGCYNISLAVTSNGCTTIQNMPNMICVQADPVASFMANPNSFSQTSQEITFVNTSTGATQFEWDFGNGNTSNDYSPSHFYTNTSGGQTVTLTASTSFGCTAQTSVFIPFTEAELIYVPNSFTPDGDMFNQVFTPVFTSGYDPYNFEMTIFNRWGEVVFVTYDAKRGWDGSYGELGRDCQAGLYVYKIIYKNPQKDERKIITGHVNLLR